jgi:hypothetical protein
MSDLRDTNYAEEIARSVLKFPSGGEARIERLRLKSSGDIEIRLSWWKDGRMQPRPLDLGELDLFRLIAKGMREGVLLPSDDSPATH